MKVSKVVLVFIGLLLVGVTSVEVRADGSETLGPPSIAIAEGTDIVGDGIGMILQPATLTVNVPASATVQQVIVYWNGFKNPPGDGQITINGNNVVGTLIGGPDFFFTNAYSFTYRADITSLGLVAPGANTLTFSDMTYRYANGVSVLVIIDDGISDLAIIQLRDGDDTAYFDFPEPRLTTVPQTYTFAPSGVDRTADFTVIAGSIWPDHPNVIRAVVNGSTTEFWEVLAGTDGHDWDHLTVPLLIPAGATSLTVEVQSEHDATARKPASLVWIGGVLDITPPEVTPTPTPTTPTPTPTSTPVTPTPTPPLGEGCTPGYWKNHDLAWPPTGYSPSDDFDTTFGVNIFIIDKTLMQALNSGGGGIYRLGRHGTAALLNAAHPDVDYPYTEAEVIALVQAGDADALEAANEDTPCPLPGWLRSD